MGAIPDGTYTVVRELRVLQTLRPDVTSELRDLREVLSSLGNQVENLEEVIQATAPRAAPLLLRFARDSATSNAIGVLGLLLAVLAIVLGAD